MDGKSNDADSSSKITYDNINIINSKLYRKGPIQLHEDGPERVVFYRVTKDKEEWIPLPERLIMRAKTQSEQILKAAPSETFANNDPESNERCFMCQDNETCGIYLTRMHQRENQKKGIVTELSRGLPSKKRKAKTQGHLTVVVTTIVLP